MEEFKFQETENNVIRLRLRLWGWSSWAV